MTRPVQGRRATNKADKLRRITQAADALFKYKGYDRTTMRDISATAGVGFGTLFDYSSSKRDLLFLIFNPLLIETLDTSHCAAVKLQGYGNQVMRLFEGFYTLYEKEPQLSRFLLRELNFYSEGLEAEKFLAQRADFLHCLEHLTSDAQAVGEIKAELPTDAIAKILRSVYAWEVRRWIATDPLDLNIGVRELRRLVDIQIQGFKFSG